MRLRTLRIWKRLKPLWLLLLGWAVVSAVLLALVGYQLFDWRGGLPRVDVASSQTIDAEGVRAVELHAEGVTVEVGSSYDVRQIQVQLYGTGYVNQRAVWQLDDDGRLTVKLDRYPVTANAYGSRYADELTMRVLLPKKSYDEISVIGDRLHAVFSQCKGKQLTARVAYGSIGLQKADVQRADLYSNTSAIDIGRSRIQYLNIENLSGDTALLDSQVGYWRYVSKSGDLDARMRKIQGIWELQSRWGDIHVGIKKWRDNVLLDLHSDDGTVTASSKKKPWKKTIPAALTEHDLLLLEGRGENMLLIDSEAGDITLDTVKFAQ